MAGATRYISSGQFSGPYVLGATDGTPRLDAIRSFTVGNATSATYCDVYLGQGQNGTAYYSVPPGSNVTLPIEQTQWVTFAFRTVSAFDGFCYVHVDSEPLAASGFQSPLAVPPLLAPQGYTPLLGGGVLAWGSVACHADGSTISTPSFVYSFKTQVFQLVASIDVGNADDGYSLLLRAFGMSTSPPNNQVSFVVTGGAPGSTCTVRYFVVGV